MRPFLLATLAPSSMQFTGTFGASAQTALAFSMNEEFAPVLRRQMDHYNHDPNSDQLQAVRNQVSRAAACDSVTASGRSRVIEACSPCAL